MLSIGRNCFSSVCYRQTSLLVTRVALPKNGVQKTLFSNSLWNKQPLTKTIKDSFLRKSGTVSVNLTAEASSKSSKPVGYWLLGCSGMVFVAVVLGGVTRLTESGLSMVTWRLLGEKLPTSQIEWEEEFKKYQQFPEYKILNKDMTLSEFKRIFYMEFAHRMWGRCIGAAYLLPATFFWATGRLTPPLKKRVVFLGSLILAQGLMGWYMVKSGLEDRFKEENDVPRVSQYRLAAHLTLAVVLYASMLRTSLHLLLPAAPLSNPTAAIKSMRKKFFLLAHSCKGLTFFTIVSGAFVAGLDAGLVYNSFPKMADKWIPDDIMALCPKLINLTENPTTVQFNHRVLGTLTLTVITAMWIMSRKATLPRRAHLAANAALLMGWLQVTLGITTLLTYVPVDIAAGHQTGSLLLLSTLVWLTQELKKVPK